MLKSAASTLGLLVALICILVTNALSQGFAPGWPKNAGDINVVLNNPFCLLNGSNKMVCKVYASPDVIEEVGYEVGMEFNSVVSKSFAGAGPCPAKIPAASLPTSAEAASAGQAVCNQLQPDGIWFPHTHTPNTWTYSWCEEHTIEIRLGEPLGTLHQIIHRGNSTTVTLGLCASP